MDLQDQLKNLFPDHVPADEPDNTPAFDQQEDPLICKYEKRKGKPITLIEDFQGGDAQIKELAKKLKTKLSVGGTVKEGVIMIQGDYRDKIMTELKMLGYKVKRVGG